MATFKDKFNFPSGVQLPFILRKKVEEEKARAARDPAVAKKEEATTFLTRSTLPIISSEVALEEDLPNRTFTSEELENKIWRSSVALVEIQKQIHRGEETYYEETAIHGNLFKGWEGYLDAKEVGTTSNSKPPKDTRWFSGSSSISRTARPPAINTQWSMPITNPPRPPTSTNNNNTTPTAVVNDVTMAPSPSEVAPKTTVPVSIPKAAAPAPTVAAAATSAPVPAVKAPKATNKPALPLQTPAVTTTASSPPAQAVAPAPSPAVTTTSKANTSSSAAATATKPPAPAVPPPPEPAAAKPADSFRIPKKKKKNDATSAAVGGGGTAATTTTTPKSTGSAKSPVEAKPAANPKSAAEPASASTTSKKTKGRKRKSFE